MLAAKATAGHNPGRPDRRRPARSRPPPRSNSPFLLSPSFSLFLSLFLSFKLPRPVTVLAAWPATMAGWTSTECMPDTSGGHRPPFRPGEVASMPQGLNQQRELNRLMPRRRASGPLLLLSLLRYPFGRWPNPIQEEGLQPPPPPLSPPVPHRLPPLVPVGLSAKAQGRRGDGHAAWPEPKSA